jgi:hypothetical protein
MQRSPGFWDNAGGEAVFEAQSNSDGRELRLQNEMLTWKTSQLGFPLERPVVITEIWQDRHRSVQNSHTLKWAEIGRLSRPLGKWMVSDDQLAALINSPFVPLWLV